MAGAAFGVKGAPSCNEHGAPGKHQQPAAMRKGRMPFENIYQKTSLEAIYGFILILNNSDKQKSPFSPCNHIPLTEVTSLLVDGHPSRAFSGHLDTHMCGH